MISSSCDDKKSVIRESVPANVIIEETFITPLNMIYNIDSPAVWHGQDGLALTHHLR